MVVVIFAAVCVRLVNLLNSSTINIVAMQMIYFSLLFFLFKGKIVNKMFCHISANAIMVGCEFVYILVMSLPADFVLAELQNNKASFYMSLLGLKLLAFLVFNIVKRICKVSNSKMSIKVFLLYSIIPIATIGIMIGFAYLDINFDAIGFIQILLILCSFLILIGNMALFYFFNEYASSVERLRHQEVVITRMELEEKRYEQIDAVNQEYAAFIHDIRHYMHTIGELAAESKDKEIINILSELQIRVSETETEMYCVNHLLNTILNEKKKSADENGIRMKITIEPEFVMEQIENIDLIAIMDNLLDNAIEAAKKCEQGYIKMYLYAKNNAHFSVIKIVNNYIGEINVQNERILTSKNDKTKHGFGIQNVQTTVEKYNGYLRNFFENGVFTTVVMFQNENLK